MQQIAKASKGVKWTGKKSRRRKKAIPGVTATPPLESMNHDMHMREDDEAPPIGWTLATLWGYSIAGGRRMEATVAAKWEMDDIMYHNQHVLLLYKGTHEQGKFVEIKPDGTALGGTYEGAYPYITDALFKVTRTAKFESQDEAFRRLAETLGVQFLIDLTSRR
jgi:hypothetical protein